MQNRPVSNALSKRTQPRALQPVVNILHLMQIFSDNLFHSFCFKLHYSKGHTHYNYVILCHQNWVTGHGGKPDEVSASENNVRVAMYRLSSFEPEKLCD